MTSTHGRGDTLHHKGTSGGAVTRRRPGDRVRQRVAVTLTGGFRLTTEGREAELPGGAQRLVALLALRGRTARSTLAGTLWPETDEQRALARLRTAIWRVNQVVPQLIESLGEQVDLTAHTEIDIREQIERSMGVLGGGTVDAATWAAGIPTRDLLPDWHDEWLIDDRERLRQLRLHTLEDIAEQLCRQGHFGLAIDAALTVLRADALRESAHRAVLRVHLAEGNIAEARRAYQSCVETFERELGVRPTPATSALLAAFPPAVARPRSLSATAAPPAGTRPR
ncbi:AfsR/SARP family transcriptional regulator [Streptomyces nigra]|uniref:AfsR/SARP family transcriptional regulator n=1 Tax=Streptomyces nigra TaxID=1827580 RepID=UPI003628EE81